MNITAFAEHVIVAPLDPPEMIGGLHLTPGKQEGIRQRPMGMVLSVGPTANKDRAEADHLHAGDVVVFWQQWAGSVFGLDGEVRHCIRSQHIIGRVADDEPATAEKVATMRERHRALMTERDEQHRKAAAVQAITDTAGLALTNGNLVR